jgi:Rod binding domain-containing protein
MSDLRIHSQVLPLSAAALAASSSASASVPSPRLVNAAHEFEAAMMKELMAPLQPGHDLLGGGEDDEDSSWALSSYAGEALGKALSEHGGLGIAKSIIHQLTDRK